MKVVVLLLLILLPATSSAMDLKSRLAAAKDKQSLREFCARFKKFGEIREAEYQSGKSRLFLCWAESEKRPEFLFGYAWNGSSWRLVIDHPETISYARAEVVVSIADNSVRLIGKDGKLLKSYEITGN